MNSMLRMAQQLQRSAGSVGNVRVGRQRVGDVSIRPQQVGLPVAEVAATGGGNVVEISKQGYAAGGLTFCGLQSLDVAASATNVAIAQNVRRPFVAQILQMPSTTFGLALLDFGVSGVFLFASDSPQVVPQECLSEVSRMPQIQWPTLDTNRPGTFQVNNEAIAIRPFRGAMWGTNLIPSMGI